MEIPLPHKNPISTPNPPNSPQSRKTKNPLPNLPRPNPLPPILIPIPIPIPVQRTQTQTQSPILHYRLHRSLPSRLLAQDPKINQHETECPGEEDEAGLVYAGEYRAYADGRRCVSEDGQWSWDAFDDLGVFKLNAELDCYDF